MQKRFIVSLVMVILTAILVGCTTSPAAPQDLYTNAQSSRATADAAMQEARFQEQFLTATAEAPIIHITETAAAQSVQSTTTADAMIMQYQWWTATAQSVQSTETAALTATAMSWTPTPNATSTSVFAVLNAESTAIANNIERDKLELERQRDINDFKGKAPAYAFVIVVLVLAIVLMMVMRRERYKPAAVDESGNVIPILDIVDGTVTDVDRNPNYRGLLSENLARRWIEKKLNLPPLLPEITAKRQDDVTHRDQLLDMATRARLPRRLLEAQSRGFLPEPSQSIETKFLLPAWDIINGWDGKNGIPYYTARGLEIIDIEKFPHLSAIGATGAGKSRRFFRPLIACALAAGDRVVIIGKSADYWPFESHPNATLLKVNKITEAGQAQRYAKILEAVVVEMNRRDDVLTSTRQSTWTHAGRNRTYIILDELGNALRLMDRDTSNQCRIWVEGLVSESRKVGFNFAIANQRATGMASILSQTGKAIFRVEADEERAHRSLSGASGLNDGYFIAKFGTPKLAGAFEPTDEEILSFLSSRPVDKVEDEDQWIEGVLSDAPARLHDQDQTPDESSSSFAELLNSLDEKGLKVLEMYQAGGISQADIERDVYGYKGGSAANKVAEIIRCYKAAIATNPNLSFQGAAG